jgi:hypothetical protein
VTGGGQDFVCVYSQRVYGVPPEQVAGTAGAAKFGYHKNGKPFLTKEPKLLLNNDKAGHAPRIYERPLSQIRESNLHNFFWY